METWRFNAKQIQWWHPSLTAYAQTRWTSFYDVGKEISGTILSYEDYIDVENRYIALIKYVFNDCEKIDYDYQSLEVGIKNSALDSSMLKLYVELSTKKPNKLDYSLLDDFVKLLLREYVWCSFLGNESLKFRFGYDYYIYIDGMINENIENKINELGLFIN